MKILFVSLGCDKNLVDTEKMLGILGGDGFQFTDSEEEADVIIALPGYLGTLNEMIMSATLNYITDDNKRKRKPIFLSTHPWKAIWDSVAAELEVY